MNSKKYKKELWNYTKAILNNNNNIIFYTNNIWTLNKKYIGYCKTMYN